MLPGEGKHVPGGQFSQANKGGVYLLALLLLQGFTNLLWGGRGDDVARKKGSSYPLSEKRNFLFSARPLVEGGVRVVGGKEGEVG